MRRLPVIAAVVAGVLLLAGCSAASTSGSSSGVTEQRGPVPGVQGGAEGGSQAADGVAPDQATSDQQVVTTGWVTVRTDDPVSGADKVVALVDELDGRIDSRTQQAGGDDTPASAQLTIRVPADSLDEAVDRLKDVGTLESVSLTSDDVTLQSRDLDAQITALRASIDRLLALVGSAATTADLIELETAISDRQAQLDSLTSQKAYLDDQVAYSTVTVSIEKPSTLPSTVPGDFWSGLSAGWASLSAAAAGALVALGVMLPWLVVAAIIVAIILVAVRLGRRRRAARPAVPAMAAAAPGGTFPVAPPARPEPTPTSSSEIGTSPENR